MSSLVLSSRYTEVDDILETKAFRKIKESLSLDSYCGNDHSLSTTSGNSLI